MIEIPGLFEAVIPGPPLSRFVEVIWFATAPPDPSWDKVLPNGAVELIVNLGAPQLVVDPERPECSTVFRESWVAGLQRGVLVTAAQAETRLVGIRFRPGGFAPFFRLDMAELTDQVVDFERLARGFAGQLREQLDAASSRVERARVVETLLLQRLDESYRDTRIVRAALQLLDQGGEAITIGQVGERMGVSQKHLIHLFHARVGLGPKLLSRVLRFDRVIRDVSRQSQVRWTEVAHAHGYYDQAHLISEFKALAGATPTEYWRSRSQDGAHIVVPQPEGSLAVAGL